MRNRLAQFQMPSMCYASYQYWFRIFRKFRHDLNCCFIANGYSSIVESSSPHIDQRGVVYHGSASYGWQTVRVACRSIATIELIKRDLDDSQLERVSWIRMTITCFCRSLWAASSCFLFTGRPEVEQEYFSLFSLISSLFTFGRRSFLNFVCTISLHFI